MRTSNGVWRGGTPASWSNKSVFCIGRLRKSSARAAESMPYSYRKITFENLMKSSECKSRVCNDLPVLVACQSLRGY